MRQELNDIRRDIDGLRQHTQTSLSNAKPLPFRPNAL
jgi:hypothetical protein